MAPMGVVKALTPKKAWGQASFTDRYLRGMLPSQIKEGISKTQENLYDALNCGRDDFTKTLRMQMKWHGEKKVKAYEYVQSFSPQDREDGLTPELAHALGMEFAQRFFSDVPCLVVTHTDTGHLHNQFLIGNINVTTGKCLQLNAKTLRQMKLFAGEQCIRHDLRGSLFEEGTRRKQEKASDAEHLMRSQGKEPVKDLLYRQIREAIASEEVECFDDFLQLLHDRHKVEFRVSGNTISFRHPDLGRPVRGTRLAADLTKEGIEMGIRLAVDERQRSKVPEIVPLSPAQMEDCREELEALVKERRGIREALLGIVEQIGSFRKTLINLRSNISFWRQEKEEKEALLQKELGDIEYDRPRSRGRSR